MRFKWDQKKNKQLMGERNIKFENLEEIFDRSYHLSQKNDDPEQWRAIGWAQGRLVTLIYEEREDANGIFYWFITAWISTNAERRLFNER